MRKPLRRPWLVCRLQQTHAFSVSEYQIGRLSGKPTIVLAYPVIADAEHLVAMVTLGLDLSWLQSSAVDSQVPAGSTLTVLDRSGTVLARYPDAASYDTTIEGWSRALELRDRETEGHAQRVTEMTLELARALRVDSAELEHVRRGALLHDIGRMGVPDNILLKPGPLNEDEWHVMRLHPTLGRDMLAPIAFLKPALAIPYYHHEKWDGTGNPQGISGEQIPLAGRIFAVVDIWDALHADRPYRKGWPEDKIRAHIKSLSGTHLEPKIAEVFLGLRDEAAKPLTAPLERPEVFALV